MAGADHRSECGEAGGELLAGPLHLELPGAKAAQWRAPEQDRTVGQSLDSVNVGTVNSRDFPPGSRDILSRCATCRAYR